MSHLSPKHRRSGPGHFAARRASRAWLTFCGSFLLLLSGFPARSAAQPAAVAPPDAAPLPKSVFVDDPQFGKDPFFPGSTRRGAQIAKLNNPIIVMPDLTVKGISGTKEKRLAIINNRTFEVGEETELKIAGQPIKIRCVEIRDKSVIVIVNGLTRELPLGSKP